MSGPKHAHPDTPITNKIIDDAGANPETRITFLIKHLANKCREFERALGESAAQVSALVHQREVKQRDYDAVSDALHEARRSEDATDMPLDLIAGELRDIANDLSESDEDAWRSRISMLTDIAGDLEAREALPPSTAADMVRADQAGAPITLKGAGEAVTYIALMNMVDRFLAWPLPDSVRSDTCVTMVGGDQYRSGTNLLTADEARQMFSYVVYGK